MGAPRASRRYAALVLSVMLALCGCLEVDGELAADGSLSLRYTYVPPRHATFKSERARLGSGHVRVENIERDRSIDGYPPGDFVTATIAVDDARQISTAPAFAQVLVEVDQAQGTLRISLPGFDASTRERAGMAPETQDLDRRALRLSLLLPGPVRTAEPAATIDGRRVTWSLTIRQYADAGETVALAASWATKPAS